MILVFACRTVYDWLWCYGVFGVCDWLVLFCFGLAALYLLVLLDGWLVGFDVYLMFGFVW